MRIPFNRRAVPMAVAALAALGLAACSGDDDDVASAPLSSSDYATKVAASACASGGKPETALQGQVPAAMRASGFTGFNCNLTLVGHLPGEGGNWSSATYKTGSRHCAYYSTATPEASRVNPGVPVIDLADATKPAYKTSLSTPAMLDSWESLRVHHGRGILIADNGQNGGGGPEIDIYDIATDCTSPQLLASMKVGTGEDGGITPALPPVGHEGNISPDGFTYYIGDIRTASYHAVDVANPARPRMIATYPIANLGLAAGTTVHGLSTSADGTRLYAVTLYNPAGAVVDESKAANGFVIFDTSEVQQRKPNARMKVISKTVFNDGSLAQHTIPIKVGGKPYLVHVDEAGSAGLSDPKAAQGACALGKSPYPMARIFDISDETKPALVSRLQLEIHDTKNCAETTADIVGLTIFSYGSHYCSVDNRENATALACSYFNSGIRVFDIRDPAHPKEIAYYNPASAPARPGSSHVRFGNWKAGGPDWCASRLDFDHATKRLTTMCQDNGLMVLEFAPNTWPFPTSTPSTMQN